MKIPFQKAGAAAMFGKPQSPSGEVPPKEGARSGSGVDSADAPTQESSRISVHDLVDIATQAWRARIKMLDAATGEIRDDMIRVNRHVESILGSLRTMGFELKDHTGDGFDYGQPLKVVGTQPEKGLQRETVLETLKPTIYWKGQIVQQGEVVVGTPMEQQDGK